MNAKLILQLTVSGWFDSKHFLSEISGRFIFQDD